MNKLQKLFNRITPSDTLEDRIDSLIDAAPERTKKLAPNVRIPKRLRFTAIAAAAVMVVSVSAFGISKLYYLPGAGLVDESGTLIIKESDIGDLDYITAYKTISALDFGDYTVTSVTYVDHGNDAGYAVWTTADEALMEQSRGSEGIPLSEWVLDDLTLILPDGTELEPESTHYSYSGTIVYNFDGESFSDRLVLESRTVGEGLNLQLAKVEGVGYSYMEYPTDRGISLMIYPANEEFDEFELQFTNNALGELERYVGANTLVALPLKNYTDPGSEKLNFIGTDGEKYPIVEWKARSHTLSSNYSISGSADLSDGSAYNYHDDSKPYYHWIRIDKPDDVGIVGVEIERIGMLYKMVRSPETSVELEMPADGERIDRRVAVFDDAGFKIEITGWERNGSDITIYSDAIPTEYGERLHKDMDYPIECDGSLADKAYARLGITALDTTEEHFALGTSGKGGWLVCEDGGSMCSWELSIGNNMKTGEEIRPDLDKASSFTLSVTELLCEYDGSWSIEYK